MKYKPSFHLPTTFNNLELNDIFEAIRNAGDKLPWIHLDYIGAETDVEIVGESRQGG